MLSIQTTNHLLIIIFTGRIYNRMFEGTQRAHSVQLNGGNKCIPARYIHPLSLYILRSTIAIIFDTTPDVRYVFIDSCWGNYDAREGYRNSAMLIRLKV